MSEDVRVKAVATAICLADCGRITPNELARCVGLARAAIAAHEAALSDAGLVIVPREPTKEMLEAGIGTNTDIRSPMWIDGWRAMVDAFKPR